MPSGCVWYALAHVARVCFLAGSVLRCAGLRGTAFVDYCWWGQTKPAIDRSGPAQGRGMMRFILALTVSDAGHTGGEIAITHDES